MFSGPAALLLRSCRAVSHYIKSEKEAQKKIWTKNEVLGIDLEKIAVSAKRMGSPFIGANIVVTGKLKYFTRSTIHAEIESLGAKAKRRVSKKTDYLICGERAGSKLAKARQLGVRIAHYPCEISELPNREVQNELCGRRSRAV